MGTDATRAPYGRRSVDVLGSVPRSETPPTYYDRPVVKPSDWRWLIITYFFVGGIAGAAQLIAGVLDLLGHHRDRPLVSAGRYVAFLGAIVSPALLIGDLKTPSRWYNMLRVFRGTSPMSIGSWTLFVFGSLSGLAALGQLGADVFGLRFARTVARVAGVPAAIAGGVLSTYTGSLLSATSTPLWMSGYRLLPAVFGISGTSTAIAVLSLVLKRSVVPRGCLARLERLALVASLVELGLTFRLDALWKQERVSGSLDEPPLVLPYRAGAIGLGMVVPFLVHLVQVISGRELRSAGTLASLAAITGGYAHRAVIVIGGKQSAEKPVDYFRMTQ